MKKYRNKNLFLQNRSRDIASCMGGRDKVPVVLQSCGLAVLPSFFVATFLRRDYNRA